MKDVDVQRIIKMNYPTEPLAIIGAHCCAPGAFSPEVFWQNLSQGKVSVSNISEERYPFSIYKSDQSGIWCKSNNNLCSVVDLPLFNSQYKPAFLKELIAGGVAPEDIPDETGMVLASFTAYNAIKSAGFDPFKLPQVPFSVFTGMVRLSDGFTNSVVRQAAPMWLQMLEQASGLSKDELKSIARDFEEYLNKEDDTLEPYFHKTDKKYSHFISRKIQSLFKLNGQGFTFDDACSSSLASLYLAQRFFVLHPEGLALCGGYHLIYRNSINLFSHNKAGSDVGSMPFDERANGLIQGEGCSYLLVRPLSAALKAGNAILGVVRGVGVSCDGKGKGHWAPCVEGQNLAISRAWASANLNESESPDLVEAHATSTRLGDATELEAVDAFLKQNHITKPVPITSVKANIGHLLEAAGATSIIKVLKALRNQTILPQTSFQEPTSKFDWNNSPLYVQQEVKSWAVSKDKKRLAMVNAYGVGGLNASVVLEGPETAESTNKETEHASVASQAIAVAGIGCVAPGAFDCKEFRRVVKQGESVMTAAPNDRGDLALTKSDFDQLAQRGVKAGFVKNYQYDWKRHNIPPKQIKFGHELIYWCLGAVDQAIDDAGMPQNIKQSKAQPERWDRSRTAVVAGTRSGTDYLQLVNSSAILTEFEHSVRSSVTKSGMDSAKADDVVKKFHKAFSEKFHLEEDVSGGVTISTYGSKVAKSYDISGPIFSLDGGHSASLTALATAYNLLQDARIDCALCVSGDRSQGAALRAMLCSKDDSVTPPAEGAVAFVLKRAEDALKNGDKIYAIIPSIETESSNVHIQDANDNSSKTTMRSLTSKEEINIDESITKTFGDFGPAKGMMALANVLLEIQEKNQVASAAWQIQHKDSEGITITMDIENVASYREKGEKRGDKTSNENQAAATVVEIREPSVAALAPVSPLRKPGARVAFLFAGQGAQYPNMMSGMTELPGAKEIIEELDDFLATVGLPNFNTVLQTEGAKLGKDTFRTQLSLLIADTFIYRLYLSQGVRPDVVMGHSYGEYPAMAAAGVWQFQAAALATEMRCLAIEDALAEFTAKRTRTAMLSTNASEDQIVEGMAAIPDAATTIFVSNRNAPTQTIIAGTYDSIKKMEAYLLSCQRLALILPVPAAFHSPLMAGVCKPFAEALKPLTFDLPNGLLLSSVTSAFESDPDVFRSNLIEQMTKPVDFITMIRKAYNVGCRHFVEVGPKKILTNLAKQILSDCTDVTFYISDNSKGGDPEKFLDVCNQLRNIQDVQIPAKKLVIETRIEKEDSRIERRDAAPIQTTPQSTLPASSYSISVCRQSGTPYEMGLQYGKQYVEELRAMVRRYVDIVGHATEKLLPPSPAMDKESLTTRFGEDGYEEMRGIADGAGIPLEAIVRHNVCLFPTMDTSEQRKISNTGKTIPASTIKMDSDSTIKMSFEPLGRVASGCVQFAGTTPNGAFIHGCNIDLPFKRIVPDSVQVQVQVRQPANRISHCFVGVTGMLGTIGGVNSKGLCVTSCTMLDYPTPFQVKPESMEHSTLIERILSECSNIDQALKMIYQNGAIGGWTIGLTEGSTGAIAQIEYCDKMVVHRDAMDFLAQANHSQLLVTERPDRGVEVPEHSKIREARLRQILTNDGAESTLAVDALTAFAALRDVKLPNQSEKPMPGAFRTINMLHRVDNVCSWMFNHTAQTLMVAATPDIYVSEDDKALWNEIPIRDLLPDYDSRAESKPQPAASKAPAVKTPVQPKAEKAKSFTVSEIARFTPAQFYDKIKQETANIEKVVTTRYIECLVEAPALPEASALDGRTLIIGSEKNPVAVELVRQLKPVSSNVVVFDLCDKNAGKSEEAIAAEIDALWKQSPIYNIFVVPSWDAETSYKFKQSDWTQMENTTILPLYLTLREIYRCANAQKEVGKLRLAAGVRLGGDGGFAGYSDRVEGGAIAGLVHNLHVENLATFGSNTCFKAVDFSLKAAPEFVAKSLIKELAHFESHTDVCYQSEKRYILTMAPEAVSASAVKAAPASDSEEVWLVTGGARGVTAELAYYLAKNRKVKLYILGSSPLPKVDPTWRTLDADGLKQLKQSVVRAALAEKKKPAGEWSKVEKALEIDKNLRRLDAANIPWTYMACDLSSYENAAQAVKQILRQEGRIAGVLHGAGFEKSATFYKKEERNVRMTADVKVGSLWSILETLEGNLPDYIVMMGSAAGRVGGNGQTDYGMSNYLCSKILNRFAALHPQCRVITVHWNAWDEVGMSVRPESLIAFKAIGMAMMPVKEGCDHFYNELVIDKYQPEITPLPYKLYQDAYLNETISEKQDNVKGGNEANAVSEVTLSQTETTAQPATVTDYVFGSNADAYELRSKLGESQPTAPVLMVCRDEQLTRLMNKAQIEYRHKSVDKPALDWIKACKSAGAAKVVVPTCTSVDPITLEFIESVKAILPVEQIQIPWTTEPAKCAEMILTVLQGGKIEAVKQEEKPAPTSDSKPSKPALLNNICLLTDDAIEAECSVDPVSDVFLQQHQLKERPILPIVMGLELVAETAKVLTVKQGLEPMSTITDVRIVRGVTCTQDAPYRLVCRLEKTETPNVWNALVKGDFYNKAGKKINENCPYYRCKVAFGSNGAKHDLVAKQTSLSQTANFTYPALGERDIYHGPTLRCLKTLRFNDGTYAIGEIIPEANSALFGSRTGDIATYPAIMDACLYTCGILNYVAIQQKAILVPDQFESIEYGVGKATPDERCECCCQLVRAIELPGGYEQKIFNYTLYNEKGDVIVNVFNCQATIIRE